ncbi:3-isopropylmalate dehydratase [Aureococcus anophagefferens]|nr:3-isopropylmalate dehydratase [Aureococcus anophagefferens]
MRRSFSITRAVSRAVGRNAPRARYLSAFRDEYLCAQLVEQLKAPGTTRRSCSSCSGPRAPGVDEAAYVKASFLAALVSGEATSPIVDKYEAMRILGTMQGG